VITVSYTIGKQNPQTGYFQGGVSQPEFINEIQIDVYEDEMLDPDVEDPVPSGKVQIHIRGTERSYRSLAEYLLGICVYSANPMMKDPDYHDHFLDMQNSAGSAAVHLIVHAPHA
jgi:hypothetical protein